jgi:hypothetical protein
MATDGERHAAAVAGKLLGDLHAGCRCADDKHAAIREHSGRAVLRGVQVERFADARPVRHAREIALAGGDDCGAGAPCPPAGDEAKTFRLARQRMDLGPAHHRGNNRRGIGLEAGQEIAVPHEAVRIVTLIRGVWQSV